MINVQRHGLWRGAARYTSLFKLCMLLKLDRLVPQFAVQLSTEIVSSALEIAAQTKRRVLQA